MILLALACLPDSDISDRVAALEAENAALTARVYALEEHERELMQQLSRWEQTLAVLQAAASGGAPPDAETLNAALPDATEGGCRADGDGFRVDAARLNPDEVSRALRLVPHRGPDGESDGFRLSGIRRGSLPESCGFKNGDIVHSVNNKPLTSMSSAMDAYNSLADAKSFNFEITRRNQRQTFDYEIR